MHNGAFLQEGDRFFLKWHQNSAQKGPFLRTAKRCPKGSVLVLLIFLSVVIFRQVSDRDNISCGTFEGMHIGLFTCKGNPLMVSLIGMCLPHAHFVLEGFLTE